MVAGTLPPLAAGATAPPTGVQAQVWLLMRYTAQGRIEQVRVRTSSGNRLLHRAAVQAVRQSQTPSESETLNGQAQTADRLLRVDFKLPRQP